MDATMLLGIGLIFIGTVVAALAVIRPAVPAAEAKLAPLPFCWWAPAARLSRCCL